jgi:acetoin utilization deacetylase AcuC-like enzyme
MKNLVIPIAKQYKPQFILISIGFDGYFRDTVASLSLSANIYPKIFQMIIDLADSLCEGKILAVLEGGYNLVFLKKIIPVIASKMAGLPAEIKDRGPNLRWDIQRKSEKMLEKIRKIQSNYWQV